MVCNKGEGRRVGIVIWQGVSKVVGIGVLMMMVVVMVMRMREAGPKFDSRGNS